MSRQDALTGRKPMTGNNRSHAMNATKRRFNLNLQKKTYIEEGTNRKHTFKITAKTARTLAKNPDLIQNIIQKKSLSK